MDTADMDASDLCDNRRTATNFDNSARRVHSADGCDNRNAPSRENCDVRNGSLLRFPQKLDPMDIEWLRTSLTKPGKSQIGLARALGIDPAGVSRILSGDRQIKLSEVPKIQGYFNEKHSASFKNVELPGETIVTKDAPEAPLKVMGMAEGGPDGWNLFNGEIVQYITRPENLKGVPGAYAVYITGHSMEPRYHPGEIVHVHPGKPVQPGNWVLVQRKPLHEGEPPLAVIKRLVRRTADKVTLAQLNPAKNIEIKAGEIVSIHRVVGASEP